MTFVTGGHSPSSDPCSEDRSNASQQRREVEEGESSRTGDLAAQVELSAYNFRPRKVDPVKLQKRSAWETQRMGQKKRRKKLDEERAKETFSGLRRQINAILNHVAERPPEINRSHDKENIYTKWHPYSYVPDVGYSYTLKEVAPSVVALQSLTGDTQHFSCSGTIVEVSEGIGIIVTVANLVKHPDADELVEKLKNDEVLDGDLASYDFYHNICLIKFKIVRPVHLPEKSFSSNIEDINLNELCSKDVVALGRDKSTHYLWVRTGKVISKGCEFDCEELLVSSCKISKEAVGGPLMDFDGNIIGMNYYHSEETPFIPSFIVSKCLVQLKNSGKVVRPWHGLRVRTSSGVNGVIIKKIEEQYSKNASDLNEGDIIDRVDGVHFSNAAELGGILLDIGAKYGDFNGMGMCLKFGVRGCERERTVLIETSTFSGLNRWPFPKPIIVRYYCRGEIFRDEWYTL
uniref:PDZ domain-containing protein n=1 Tax=Oryza punctata TaxID=4537 RepID=A0A0E0M2R9_ORYPU